MEAWALFGFIWKRLVAGCSLSHKRRSKFAAYRPELPEPGKLGLLGLCGFEGSCFVILPGRFWRQVRSRSVSCHFSSRLQSEIHKHRAGAARPYEQVELCLKTYFYTFSSHNSHPVFLIVHPIFLYLHFFKSKGLHILACILVLLCLHPHYAPICQDKAVNKENSDSDF